MNIHESFIETIMSIKNKLGVDPVIVQAFLTRIKAEPRLTRDEGAPDHLCAFLIPVNKEARKIFIGHHIKAGSWIPPGGHIDKGEVPLETVRREFTEELGHTLTNERIELFDLSIIPIPPGVRTCSFHYDFWFLVHTQLIDFHADKKEFYEAGWYPFDAAVRMVTYPTYQPRIKRLASEV